MADLNNMFPDPPADDQPPINRAIEDALAMSGYDQESREMTLTAWMQIGAEYLAREVGRNRAREIVQNTDRFLRDAQLSNPWPE